MFSDFLPFIYKRKKWRLKDHSYLYILGARNISSKIRVESSSVRILKNKIAYIEELVGMEETLTKELIENKNQLVGMLGGVADKHPGLMVGYVPMESTNVTFIQISKRMGETEDQLMHAVYPVLNIVLEDNCVKTNGQELIDALNTCREMLEKEKRDLKI